MKLEDDLLAWYRKTQAIKCPHCKKEIQDTTIKCEHCGEEPVEYLDKAMIGAGGILKDPKSWSKSWVGGVVVFAFIIHRIIENEFYKITAAGLVEFGLISAVIIAINFKTIIRWWWK